MAAVAALSLAGLAATPQRALADQFTIRSGVGAGDDSGATISIAGDGFRFLFGGDSTGSVSDLGVAFCGGWPCRPETTSFNHTFTGFLGSGSGEIGGTSYDRLDFDGSIEITGDAHARVITTRSDGWVTAEGPFAFTAFLNGSANGTPLFSHRFLGSGTAMAFWSPQYFDGSSLSFEDPVATPEPSTFLLFGLGAAALARARARRRAAVDR